MTDDDWDRLVADLTGDDNIDAAVTAAETLHRVATLDDVPRLLRLLRHESFFVREAAAWPLTELAGTAHLLELLHAYQRGFDRGHDNDGFSAALIDMAAAHPGAARSVLEPLASSPDQAVRDNAT
jgi:HEAT repeat protein